MRVQYLLVIILLLTKTISQAQCDRNEDVVLIMESKSVDSLEEFCLEITVENFSNIASIQTAFLFDESFLEFTKINEKSLLGFTLNENMADEGVIRFLYIIGFAEDPVEFADGTSIFEICFKSVGKDILNTKIEFFDLINFPVAIATGDGIPLTPCLIQGNVSIGGSNGCDHPDYNALMALYNSTDGPNWINNDGWLEGATGESCDPCDFNGMPWFGIECSQGRVHRLALSNNNVSGILPKEIGTLSELTSLAIIGNNLQGAIPKEIGHLNRLEGLNLSVNKLTGNIPIELRSLNNLKSLSLGTNNFAGEIPFELFEISSLEFLDLRFNQLNGEIPVQIGKLINLKSLNLGVNQFNGQIPPIIGSLNLSSLLLHNNEFDGCIPLELNNLCDLTTESILNCAFSNGELLTCQYDFRENEGLPWGGDFGRFCGGDDQIGASCSINGQEAIINDDCECVLQITQPVECDSIGQPCDDNNFETFDDIYDDDCNCVGIIPSCPNDAKNLYSLYEQCNGEKWVFFNDIDSTSSTLYSQGEEPWNLNEHPDDWRGVDATEEGGCITSISLFRTKGTKISNGRDSFLRTGIRGELPAELKELKYLQLFSITNDSLEGNLPDYFGDFEYLWFLRLDWNQLSGVIPTALNKLRRLTFLSLDDNDFISPIPTLDSLDILRTLSLRGNSFDRDIPNFICDYDSLRVLDLSDNEFKDSPILECLRELETLEYLSLNDINAIDGIPEWICDFQYLRSLQLGGNCLNTELLPCIGSVDSLRTLSIYNSKIFGTIPPEYCNLNELRNISLGGNELEGDFPLCFDDFQNLETIIYQNNKLTRTSHIINDIEARWYFIGDNCFNEMPDLTNVIGWTTRGTAINCVNNKLSFEDLLQNESIFNDSTLNTYYAPQALVYVDTVFQVVNGTEFTIDLGIDEGIAGNQYRWLKDGLQIDLIQGLNKFSFDPIRWEDEGVYTVEITNPTLRELTLFSHPIKIEILCHVINTSQNLTICESESVEIGNALFDANNTEGAVTLSTDRGCDSIIEVNLNILVENEILVERTLCENEEENILGEVFSKDRLSGIIERPGTNGCVERTIVNFSLLENSKSTIDTFLCDFSSSLSINDQSYEASGSYEQNFPIANRCDSILNIMIVNAEIGDPCNDYNENTDNDTVQDDCTCLGEPPCLLPELMSDDILVNIGEEASIDFLSNDLLPFDYILTSLELPEIIKITNTNPLVFTISELFIDDLSGTYEICDQSCELCSTEVITFKNEELTGIIKTNAFTPDGDGDNDLLRFTNSDFIENSELWIYNRWGDQIYKKENYTNDWDGGGYPDGVYYYILKVGETVIKNSLTILR